MTAVLFHNDFVSFLGHPHGIPWVSHVRHGAVARPWHGPAGVPSTFRRGGEEELSSGGSP